MTAFLFWAFILTAGAGILWFVAWAASEREWGIVMLTAVSALSVLWLISMVLDRSEYQSKQPHIQLLKSDWRCTQTVSSAPTYVQSGNVMVPVGGGSECVEYGRIGR